MSDFSNKVVVITGGNGGIGESVAELFNELGAKIALFARDQTKLKKVNSKLNTSIAVVGGVSNLADLDKLYKATYVGSLNNPAEFSPEINIWVHDAQTWDCVNDKLTSFDKNPR